MFVITLIAKAGGLDPALVESLRNAWGGQSAQWLAADEAAEFALAAQPDNLWDVWNDVQELGVDLVCQPIEGRNKKMLLADMDSTMIQQECIDELADEAGVGVHVADITARAMNGELDFEAAIDERVGLLKGLDAANHRSCVEDADRLYARRASIGANNEANGGYSALVSGGFTAFTEKVATDLGFDENRANTLEIVDDLLTGKVVRPILGQQAKLDAMHEITTRLGIAPQDVIAVGDGMNDLLMLDAAGTGVALHGKPALQEKCDVRINHGDLTALLYLQGYAKTEFVT
ncbi:Phosphoserine phosphatase [Nymphon striatum]|nr:Phosphoserine phosphatase [Nymphon striatum]